MSAPAACATPVGEAAGPAGGVHPRDEDDRTAPQSDATSPRHAAKQQRVCSSPRHVLDHRARQVADGWRLVREIRAEIIGAMRRLGGARTSPPSARKVHTPTPAKKSARETYAAAAADSPCVLCASLAETSRGACGARRGEGRVLSCARCSRQFGEGCVRGSSRVAARREGGGRGRFHLPCVRARGALGGPDPAARDDHGAPCPCPCHRARNGDGTREDNTQQRNG